MASSLISNTTTSTDRSRDPSRRKKKKKAQLKHQQEDQNHIKWKSQAQQQIYSSKLHQALARVNLTSSSSSSSTSTSAPRRGKAVREAADRVLAVTAKGRSRWSRAILTNRLKLKFRKHKRQRVSAAGASAARSKKPRVSVLRLKGKNLPAVQRKVRFLGRLVPGCRKQPVPVILEEAIDYISALEMQVRAMTALADLLSGSAASGVASTSSAPPS
ncbi:transcription factor bHLH147-like [Senna tora]|uniref:Transcription factor bHLH147-like n=1 Tax=Senna tora TaxID=362788 RepID=A0A834X4N7_9FABA|nr:transcription factor bHLH147-like [Senna tora]